MPNLLIRTLPVQAGTAAYRECLRCDAIIQQANAQLAALKPRIEENKGKVGNVEMGASKNLSFA